MNDPEMTLSTNRAGIAASKRYTRATDTTATISTSAKPSAAAELDEAAKRQDTAHRVAYELLCDLVDAIGWPALERALAQAGDHTPADWRREVDEARREADAAAAAIAVILFRR